MEKKIYSIVTEINGNGEIVSPAHVKSHAQVEEGAMEKENELKITDKMKEKEILKQPNMETKENNKRMEEVEFLTPEAQALILELHENNMSRMAKRQQEIENELLNLNFNFNNEEMEKENELVSAEGKAEEATAEVAEVAKVPEKEVAVEVAKSKEEKMLEDELKRVNQHEGKVFRIYYGSDITSKYVKPCSWQKFIELSNMRSVKDAHARIRALKQVRNAEEMERFISEPLTLCAIEKKCGKEGKQAFDALNFEQKKDFTYSALKNWNPDLYINAQRFVGNYAKNENAISSNVAMIDYDHVGLEKIQEIFGRCSAEYLQGQGILYMGKTSSEEGLRIVALRRSGESIADTSARVTRELDIPVDYDPHCVNLGRASVVVPWEYIYYVDPKMFEFESQEEAARAAAEFGAIDKRFVQKALSPKVQMQPSVEVSSTCTNGEKSGKVYPTEFRGVPYIEIIKSLMDKSPEGYPHSLEEVAEGERNNTYYWLAMNLRYITDFNREYMFSVLPDFGLSSSERYATIDSALGSERCYGRPKILSAAIEETQSAGTTLKDAALDIDVNRLSITEDTDVELCKSSQPEYLNIEDYPTDVESLGLPPLPRLHQILMSKLPERTHQAMIIMSHPAIGALATGVRSQYWDGKVHALNFISTVIGEPSDGKSFFLEPVNKILYHIKEQDKLAGKQIAEYQKAVRRRAKDAELPEEPEVLVRETPINSTDAYLASVLKYEKHLIFVCDELSDWFRVEKNRIAGSKKNYIIRSYDNGNWGQARVTSDGVTGYGSVFANFCFGGTEHSHGQLITQNDIYDGLASREMLCTLLPDDGALPEYPEYEDSQVAEINSITGRLMEQQGMRYVPCVNEAIKKWCIERSNLGKDIPYFKQFLRRAGVDGFRSGVEYSVEEDCARLTPEIPSEYTIEEQKAADYAVWNAEYELRQYIKFYGEDLLNYAECSRNNDSGYGDVLAILESLPQKFSRDQLNEAFEKAGKDRKNVRYNLSRWRKSGRVKTGENGMLIKC